MRAESKPVAIACSLPSPETYLLIDAAVAASFKACVIMLLNDVCFGVQWNGLFFLRRVSLRRYRDAALLMKNNCGEFIS